MLGAHHPLLRSIRRAVQRGGLTESGFAVAEGFHLLHEALRSNVPVDCIVAAAGVSVTVKAHLPDSIPVHEVEERIFEQFSSTENAQGVLSLVQIPHSEPEDLFAAPALVVALDGVQDPGNAGAIVRAAEAFGSTGALFLKGSVNPYNPKTLRGSAGSLFRLPFAQGSWEELLELASRTSTRLVAAMPHGGFTPAQARLHEPVAILIGNEGRGIPGDHAALAEGVRIPTEQVESLNAALAAGILLYEARRQRQAQ